MQYLWKQPAQPLKPALCKEIFAPLHLKLEPQSCSYKAFIIDAPKLQDCELEGVREVKPVSLASL